MLSFLFLSSGLFLGWSLGANDAANIFGTAVGSGMLKFRTAAVVVSIFIVIGAAFAGGGTSETLEHLGSVNELAGAFIVALAAAIAVYFMARLRLPVSTSQSIVGSIVGWNLFSGNETDLSILAQISSTWIIAPVMAACFSIVVYKIVKFILTHIHIHILKVDYYNRLGFLFVGAFGAYSLGANNIANVMGVFVPVSPFKTYNSTLLSLSSVDMLFLIGSFAIVAGVVSYSAGTMKTIGKDITELSPVAGLVVVSASSLVLFIFSSIELQSLLSAVGLPTLPLVPVSSSQAAVGAILGIVILKGGRGVNYRLVGKIAAGWVITPIAACLLSVVSLFVMQNVFKQQVYKPAEYSNALQISPSYCLHQADDDLLFAND